MCLQQLSLLCVMTPFESPHACFTQAPTVLVCIDAVAEEQQLQPRQSCYFVCHMWQLSMLLSPE